MGIAPIAENREPKVLIWDLESSPNLSYTWGVWEQNVIKVKEHRQVICVGWKWLHEKKIHCKALPDFVGYKKNPKDNSKLVKHFYDVLCTADISIAHNGIKFDDKMMNVEFIKHGLKPPPPRKSLDTLRVSRSTFGFNSHRLNDIGEFLGIGKKVPNPGFAMWLGCLNGEKKSWDLMKRYCKGDIILLQNWYLACRPWMKNHPDLTNYTGDWACPTCESSNVQLRGSVYLKSGAKQRYQCKACGSWSTGKLIKRKK